MKRLLLPLTIAVALLIPAWSSQSAFAQSDESRKLAKKYFEEGEREYTLGRFENAIKKYQLGFEAVPDQWFLYNIAQSYRQLDDCKMALFFYKRYLAFAARPESERKRSEAKEKEVRDTLIPAMQDKCKRDKEVREKPPEFVENGGSTTTGGSETGGGSTTGGSETGGGSTTGGSETGGGTTTTTTTTGNGTNVASTGDDDDDDFDDDDDDIRIGASTTGDKPSLLATNVSVGPSFLGVGSELDVPTQFSLALGAGYPLALGPADLVAGALINYTPVPWNANGMSGTAALTSILANAVVGYEVIPKLAVRGELGLGVQLFSGLESGNPFTLNGAGTTGALSVFNLRIGLGAEYAVTKNIVVTAAPVVYSYSPAPPDMRMDMDALTRFEILVGAGYRM